MTLFSRRHRRALAEGELDVLISERLRGRLIHLLRRFNESWYYQPNPNDNWTEQTDALSELAGDLLEVYGTEELTTQTGNVTRTVDHEGWLRYAAGEGVLDAVEQFVTYLPDERQAAFIGEINRVFGEEDAVWRMLDQQFDDF